MKVIDEVYGGSIWEKSLRRLSIMPEIKYDIIKKVGVISESSKGWTKELNFISWNGREPKYDLRE